MALHPLYICGVCYTCNSYQTGVACLIEFFFYLFYFSRLALACGGMAMNSVDDELTEDCLGHAGLVYEHVLVSTGFTSTLVATLRESNVCLCFHHKCVLALPVFCWVHTHASS